MNKIEGDILICARIDDTDGRVKDAAVGNCLRCGTSVWIAPSSRIMIFDFKLSAVCPQCAGAVMREANEAGDETVFVTRPTREQVREIKQEFENL